VTRPKRFNRQQEGKLTVYLSTTKPPGDSEELYADPIFLIKVPDQNGQVSYYLTKALQRYVVPAPADDDGTETIAEYFDRQIAGKVCLAVDVTPEAMGLIASDPQAQTQVPPSV
jgi:hypothetical protein